MSERQGEAVDDFSVDTASHLLSSVAQRLDPLLKRLGRLETRLLEDDLPVVDKPVYVTGLARSGSTLLLEILNWQPDVVTHRYRDFPLLHVPVLWNRFLGYAARESGQLRERAHRDGMLVNRDSPEAFEEVLWMSFFEHLHDATRSAVLDARTENPEFEAFYRDHVRKLLMLREGRRYVCKGNYNVTRLAYLQRIFPDARFVVPVRDPYWHVASLVKQQRLFLTGQRGNPRALSHLQRVGHFEFGADRRAVHTGDTEALERVLACWREGREVEGWARYWSMIYDHVLERLAGDASLARATLVLPYEALCREPAATVEVLFRHCGFVVDPPLLERARERVKFPDYYRPDLTKQDRAVIDRVTGDTARRLNDFVSGRRSDPSPGAGPTAGVEGIRFA